MSDTPAPVGNPSAPTGTSSPAPVAPTAPATGSNGPAAPVSMPATTAPAAQKPAPVAQKPVANAPKPVPTALKTGENPSVSGENTQIQAVTSQQVAIKVLKPHPALGAFAGDTTKVPAAFAAQLIASGHAAETTALVEAALAKPTDAQLVQAKAAYARYGAVTDFKNIQGNAMPEFEKLPEAIQCAWSAAANLEYSHKAE